MTGPPTDPLGRPIRLAVLLSGAGSTLQNLIDRMGDGRLAADIRLVIANREGVRGLERARNHGIENEVWDPRRHADRAAFSRAQGERIAAETVDLVVMAGYLYRWLIPEAFQNRVINIHPALLPAFGGKGFYGKRVHQAVLEAGCKVTGCTVHFCDDRYDHGPIILQAPVKVCAEDTPETLARRVQAKERKLLPEAIQLYAEGRLRVEGRRVRIVD